VTPLQTIAVVVRLFAIWLTIYVARAAPPFYREVVRLEDSAAAGVTIGIAILLVLFILFLWFFPRTVARVLLDERVLAPAEVSSPDTWFAVGCALLGLWLIIPSLGSLIWHASVVYLARRESSLDISNLRYEWIYYGVTFIFGVWLLLGARGVRKLFWWARARGRDGP
jgi:hypothetical protein